MNEPVKISHPVRLDDLITAIRDVHDEPLRQLEDAVGGDEREERPRVTARHRQP